MLLYIREVTEHGRYVLCLVAQAGSLLVAVVDLVLLLGPEDLHDQALKLFLDTSRLRQFPSRSMELYYNLFASNRLGISIFLGIMVFTHIVCIFMFRILSDHFGRREHLWTLYTVRFVYNLHEFTLVFCVVSWLVLGNWAGVEMLPLLKTGWLKAMKMYLYDHNTQRIINDVQLLLNCCGYDRGYETWQDILNWTEPVPYSCCRPDSLVPCPVTKVHVLLNYDTEGFGEPLGTRLVESIISDRECPDAVLQYLLEWPLSYFPMLLVILWPTFVFGKLALSSVHNATKNRDPLALTPATVFNWLGQPPVPKDQVYPHSRY